MTPFNIIYYIKPQKIDTFQQFINIFLSRTKYYVSLRTH